MSFIDWSDSEGILALLIEFVADQRNECPGDSARQQFLEELLVVLTALEDQFPTISAAEAINELRSIYNSIDQQFKNDSVMVHVKGCIEELEHINN